MPHILEWDFTETAPHPSAQVIHYYDNYAQDFLPSPEGLNVHNKAVSGGNWKLTTWGPEKLIYPQAEPYTFIRSDHPVNGTVHMVGLGPDYIEYFRYTYMLDIAPITTDWSFSLVSDNPITDASITVSNIDNSLFTSEQTLFLPGSLVDFRTSVGDNGIIQMAKLFIDEVDFGINDETVSLSLRNQIGYKLNDQTCDDRTHYEGTLEEIINSILTTAGCRVAAVQPVPDQLVFDFDPDTTFLDAITEISESLATTVIADDFTLAEQPGGALIFGTQDYIQNYIQNSYYFFDGEKDVFSRNFTKSADAAYSYLMAKANEVAGAGVESKTIYSTKIKLNTWDHWGNRPHKTCHIDAPCDMTQAGLQAWAEAMAHAYDLLGVTQSYSSPYRPQLLPGDLATIDDGTTQQKQGLITEVTHSFSRSEGMTTDFSLDSGGVFTDESAVYVYTRTAKVNGKNRKQSLVDLMRDIYKK